MPLHLIIMNKVVLIGVIFKKWSVSVTIRNYKQVKNCSRSHTNHVSIIRGGIKKMTKSNYLSLSNIWQKSKSCGHAHLHYVYKHHTKYQSCSSKTVGGDSRTNHVSISGQTNKMTKSNYLSLSNILWKSKSCGHAHLHYVYKHPTKY